MNPLTELAELDRRLLEMELGGGGVESFRALLAIRGSCVGRLAKQATEAPTPELSETLRDAITTGEELVERLARHRQDLNAGDCRLTHLLRMFPSKPERVRN